MGFGDGPKPPPTPDYAGAARETARGNIEAARVAARANRVNQYNPFYSLTYSNAPPGAPDFVDVEERRFNPQKFIDVARSANPAYAGTLKGVQKYYDSGAFTKDYGDVIPDRFADISTVKKTYAEANPDTYYQAFEPGDYLKGLISQVEQQPTSLDLNQIYGTGAGTTYDLLLNRIRPDLERDSGLLESRLAAQGVSPGTPAYERARLEFDRQRNDAYLNAALQARGVALNDFTAQQNYPLQRLQAILSGGVTPGQLTPGAQATTAGPDILGAVGQQFQGDLDRYNAQIEAANQPSALGVLGGAALGVLTGGAGLAALGVGLGSAAGLAGLGGAAQLGAGAGKYLRF